MTDQRGEKTETQDAKTPDLEATTPAPEEQTPGVKPVSGKRKIVGAVSLIGSHAVNDGFTDVLNPIYNTISLTTGLSLTATTSLATTMNFFNTLFKLPSGILLSKIGKTRLILVLGMLVQALALIVLTYMKGYTGMLISMALVGVGWSVYHPASYSMVALLLDKKRRTFLTSLHNISGSLGPLIFVAAAGALTVAYDWQTAVRVICIASIVVTIIVFFTLPRDVKETKDVKNAPDNKLKEAEKKKKPTILEMGKSIVVNKNFMLICLLGAIRGFTHRGLTVFIPIFLAQSLGWPEDKIGYLYSFMVAWGITAQLVIGLIGDKVGLTRVLLVLLFGASACVVGLLLVSITPMIVFFVFGIGFFNYGIRPIMWSFAMSNSKEEAMPMAMSVLDFSNQSLATFSPILGGVVADIFGIKTTMGMYAITYFLAALIAVYMNNYSKKHTPGSF